MSTHAAAPPAPVESPPLWQPMLLAAMAGGLAWGIRGQYGHETGAMMAGLLMGFVLVLLFCLRANSLAAARAVALCTVGIGFGGSETYAQSVGLTHDAAFIGNWSALLWGMLGLSIKGAVWVGFGGIFLGMGLGGVRYRSREMLLVMLGLIALHFVGVKLLNRPFDPANHVLPPIYFSHDWSLANDPSVELKPRPEMWGGLVFALLSLVAYTGFVRRDPMAPRMGLWGILGGALGFPLSQVHQAWHAWDPAAFGTGFATQINWWNFMETGFGCFMGATLGLGLWLHRRRIAVGATEPASSLPGEFEAGLLLAHVALLVGAEFIPQMFAWYGQWGYVLGLIPAVGIVGGRWWPYLLPFFVTAIPITGKTVRNLIYEEHAVLFGSEEFTPFAGWMLYIVLPLLLAGSVAIYFARRRSESAQSFLSNGLLFCTWLYFALNFAFFRFPWPWEEWTGRTPNALVFVVFALGLTTLALSRRPRST
ncbi:MAG: hypothetical protein JNG89_19890 [Planctomycetaceae bacterium]|nr:hypothetical protein [Planctomycetaceae bacterium]